MNGIVGRSPTLRGRAGNGAVDGAGVTLTLYRGSVVSGTPIQELRVTRAGVDWTAQVTLEPGAYTLRATQRHGKRRLTGSPRTFTVSADPVLGAAGDIACDPASPSFHGGAGAPSGVRCQERATSDLLLDADVTAALAVGDLQYESAQPAAFARSFAPTWGRLGSRLHPAIGNHEYVPPHPTAGYFDYFHGAAGPRGSGWYSFDLDGWHLISLNSNCGYIGGCGKGSAEVRWLAADLAAHPATCTLAFWHHPRWSSGRHGDQGQMSRIWMTLAAAGADVVISGHDHDYERFAPLDGNGHRDDAHGIREFVVGTGGKNLDPFPRPPEAGTEVRDDRSFGVLELALHPAGYDWRFVPVGAGGFTDSGSQRCH